MMGVDIIEWAKTHNTPSELMVAVKELTGKQRESLALDLVWKLSTDHGRLMVKKAIMVALFCD